MSNWTEEETNELRRLRVLGYSFSLIGEKVGRSEDACVSRANRIGMRIQSPARSIHPIPASPPEMIGAAPKGQRLAKLLELSASSCRWPYGDPKDVDFGFCGCEAEPGKSYCAHHAEMAVVKRAMPKIRKRPERLHDVLDARFDRWAA